MWSIRTRQISITICLIFSLSTLLMGFSARLTHVQSASTNNVKTSLPVGPSFGRAGVTPQAATYPSFTNFNTGPAAPVFTGGGVGAWDQSVREKVQVIQENGIYRMWYVGHRGTDETTSKVGYATSIDGVHWTRYANNPIISRSSQDQDICVVKDQNGLYFMYVEVNDDHIDLMTSIDGIAWTPYANNPVVVIGTSPVAWREGNTWYMLYEHMIPVFDIYLATSTDGMNWTGSPRNPVLHEAEPTIPDSVIKEGNTYHIYYHLDVNGQAFPSFHAVSTDLTAWTSRQQVSTMSSQYIFYNSDGAIWSYLWNAVGDHNYYLRFGQDSNPTVDPPALRRQYKLDDGSGNVATDSSSFHANGTVVGSPTWVAGNIGGGLQLNGSSQYVDTGFTQHLDLWTISAWVKSPSAPNGGPASGPINYDKNFQINWNHPDPAARGAAGAYIAGQWATASFGALNADTWYNLTATFDGNNLKAYKDGVLITTSPTPPGYMAAVETSSALLGRHANANQFFGGTIDEVRIYGQALTAAEVAQLAQVQVDTTAPSAPNNLQAQAQGEQVNLSWQASSDPESGISNYRIYRDTLSGGNKALLTTISGTTLAYTDSTTAPTSTYYYQVSAVNGANLEGARSAEAGVTTGNNPPGAPTGLTATPNNQQVALDWTNNTEVDLAGYRVYQATSSGGQYQLITPNLLTSSALTVTGLTNGTTYFFKVTGVDSINNESAFSGEVSATPNTINPNAALYYRFEEGQGSQVADASNHGWTGVLVGNPTWVAGKVGGGLQLNGSSQYVDAGFTQHFDLWTISLWVKSPSAPNGGPASGPINFDQNFQINWNHPAASFRGAAGFSVGGNWYPASFGALQADTWYQLTATYDGETLKAYTNGVLITSNTAPSGPAALETTPLKLGRHANANQFFAGTIDEVRIYGQALSAAEVVQLAQVQVDTTPPSTPGNLQAQAQGEQVNLTWQASTDSESSISNYRIYRDTLSGGNKALLTTISGTTLAYTDSTTAPSSTYYYQVSAINGANLEGARSAEASVTTGNNPPGAPTGLTATANNQQVLLDWANNTEVDLAGYRVYQSASAGGQYQLITPTLLTSSALTITGLTNGTPYFFKVTAVDSTNNESAFSAEVSATPNNANPTLPLYYNFEEGQGSQVADASNHGWTGVLVGNPTWVAGKVGGGLLLDGSSQYVDAGFTQHLNLWTISLWVKSPSAPSAGPASGPINFDQNFQINWNHPAAAFRGAAGLSVGGNWYPASFGALQADTWYQLTATYDGETLKAYTNGVLITSNTAPSGPAALETSSLKLGRHANANQFFGGTIDELQIYNIALSDTQVAALMQNDTTPPAGVTGFTATPNGERVNLSWQASTDPDSGISNYRIYRDTLSGGNKALLTTVSGTTLAYTDSTTAPSSTYYYQVSAVNGANLEGARSAEAGATTGNNPPGAPTGLIATGGNQQVLLDWANNAEVDLAGYRVYQSASAGGQYQLITSSLITNSAYTVTGLTNGTPYFFKVTAVDSTNNESAFSAEVSATPTATDPSLVLYYKLDEGSGTQTVDSSNHVAPANLIGNPTWIAGVTGNGLSFSGSGQYVDTGFNQNLQQWTISTWVKSPTVPNGGPASGPINFDGNFQINWNHPSASFRGAAGILVGGSWYSATFGALQADTWYQLTATYDGHTLITYKNGVATDNNPAPEGPAAAETGTLKLARHANAAQYFSGTLDEVRVFNRALSAAEVNALAQ